MDIEVLDDPQSLARRAAAVISEQARAAVASSGRCVLALSGGRTPWDTLRALADESMPWSLVEIVQVDERLAPRGSADRNLTQLLEALAATPLPGDHLHAMPVDDPDPRRAAASYAAELQRLAGRPPVLDLVQLGLGADGHTASLVPGDAVLEVADADVAVTEPYQGRRRMTLTFPILNRARSILWIVAGSEKADALARLMQADPSIPAGRIRRSGALVLADRAAAAKLHD